MAQVLVGYDRTGSIQQFDEDGNLSDGTKLKECMFLSFSRLLVKDEIKKGSFSMTVAVNSAAGASKHSASVIVTDFKANDSFKINSPVGEYGILYASNSAGQVNITSSVYGAAPYNEHTPVGLIYYQAGVVVLTSSVFMNTADSGFLSSGSCIFDAAGNTLTASLVTESITGSADGLRTRIGNIQFNNTIELNSSVYFCRVKHNEFNYSSNPTYLTGSQIRVKTDSTDIPISYFTSIGLYSADNQLLAVGKFSEAIRKDNNIELTLRCRMDY